MIILISGKMGSGKSTIADYLQKILESLGHKVTRANQNGNVPPKILVNGLIFDRQFRKEVVQTIKSFGVDQTREWLIEEVGMGETEAKVFVKSIMRKEGW